VGLFFIERPVFAWVISIIIMLGGIIAFQYLPVEQYPAISPPAINISASYPGASAKLLSESVVQVIEQRLTGIDNLRYMSSTSDSSGSVSLTLTFETGTDPDTAQVQVQNKLSLAMPLLPEEVRRSGVIVTKTRSNLLMVISFFDINNTMNQLQIGDYITSRLADNLGRISGVGSISVFGQQHAMRVWLNPQKLASYKVTVPEVIAAIRAQNAIVSGGQLGELPALENQQLNAPIYVQSRLQTVEQFEKILIRADTKAGRVFLSDVARIEMGGNVYKPTARYQGDPAVGVGVQLASGANALKTSSAIKDFIEKVKPSLPPGLMVDYPYDTTTFVKLALYKVLYTILEAICLVFFVMYIFLQSFRTTLIPLIAIPVVLLGTLAVLAVTGFSINLLTMFALVLAIGLLVDDAIIVVENVERLMEEDQLSPRDATRECMKQITGALIAISGVLSAVFIPMAFFPGATGAIYRQFSITLVSAMLLSVIIAIVLTPALCASFLKRHGKNPGNKHVFGNFFERFNILFQTATSQYEKIARYISNQPKKFLSLYGGLLVLLAILLYTLPTSFLPDEDEGLIFVQVIAPAGATEQRTLETIKKVENYFLEGPAASDTLSVFSVLGFSFAGSGQNTAMCFIRLKDWSQRKSRNSSVFYIARQASQHFLSLKDAMVFAAAPPAMRELGNSTGFNFELIDRTSGDYKDLIEARNKLIYMTRMPNVSRYITGVRPNGLDDAPSYAFTLDYSKIVTLGIPINDVIVTLQAALGSSYIDEFIDKGRIKRVILHGATDFRMLPEDIGYWYVRNQHNEMIALASLGSGKWGLDAQRLERFNGFPSVELLGSPAGNESTGTGMKVIERLVKQLPKTINLEWTGISYEENIARSQTTILFALSLLAVFLCLAALYESWTIPFAVMLGIPFGIFGAALTAKAFGLSNDVYFKLGLLSTVGLSAKNAILIVEFAKTLHSQGMPLLDSAIHAGRQRLRPIIMTSMAFILGITPLALSQGAGSGSQNAIGRGMIGGLLTATFLAIFFVPLFFILIENMIKRYNSPQENKY
jgi:hydrophobe/amphiphile efflux-1 (HAE1) family protein